MAGHSRRAGRALSTRGVARLKALIGLTCPVTAALLLPGPTSQWRLIREAPQPDAAVGAITMLAAIGAAWMLVGWALIVTVTAAASRLPGAFGQASKRVLARVAPAVIRRIVVTAAGVSLATGMVACATPAGAGATAAAGGQVTISAVATMHRSAPAAEPAATTTGSATGATQGHAASGATGAVRLDLDWPTDRLPAASSGTSSYPAATATTPSATPPPEPADTSPVAPSRTGTASTGTSTPRAPQANLREPAARAADDAGTVVVLRGDTLWSIAAAHLPAGSDSARIDEAWHAWFTANRSVIGPDPDLILPGQVLTAPDLPTPTETDTTPRSPR